MYYDQVSDSGRGTSTLTQNSDCIAQPVSFLTNNQSTLTPAITSMNAGGSTIIPVCSLWGYRHAADMRHHRVVTPDLKQSIIARITYFRNRPAT